MDIQELNFSEFKEILKWPEWKINLLYYNNFKYDLRKELIKQKKDLQEKREQLDSFEMTPLNQIKI